MEQPWIASAEAQEPLAYASAVGGVDALKLGADLQRRFGLTPEQRAQVLTQAELRARASRRWHIPVDDLLFTRDGLEQASRPAVAQWRARRLREFGAQAIADLGCGLGFESRALTDAGLRVKAVELDAHTAELARANLWGRDAEVVCGDVTDPEVLEPILAQVDAVFLDPARRDPQAPRTIDGLTGHRVSDPTDWSPSWPWIDTLAKRQPRTVVKVAPGIDHALIPDGGSAVWTAVDGDLVEASTWFPGFAADARRSALSIAMGSPAHLDSAQPVDDTIGAVGAYLLDVAPVVTRSGLVTTLAATAQAHRIDEHIAYLSMDAAPTPSPFYTIYSVLDVMNFDRKRIGAWLRNHNAGSLTVTKRGFAADTELLGTQWRKSCKGSRPIVIALTRIDDAPTAIICTT
jgi:hypothetical protein